MRQILETTLNTLIDSLNDEDGVLSIDDLIDVTHSLDDFVDGIGGIRIHDVSNRILSAVRRNNLETVKRLVDSIEDDGSKLFDIIEIEDKVLIRKFSTLLELLTEDLNSNCSAGTWHTEIVNEYKEKIDRGLRLLFGPAGRSVRSIYANAKDWHGKRLLHCSTSSEMTNLLLDYGAEIEARGEETGMTPLAVAVATERNDVVVALIGRGANVNTCNAVRDRPLHYVSSAEIAKLLLDSGAKVNVVNYEGDSVLINALRRKLKEVVFVLLENGADANRSDYNGWAPLHQAVLWNCVEIMSSLLEYGANIKALDVRGMSCLHYASRDDCNSETIEFLLKHGLDINQRDKCGDAPLHIAIVSASGNIECLIKNGADVNLKNGEGDTPIHIATANGRHLILKQLLAAGSDVNMTNDKPSSFILINGFSAEYKPKLCADLIVSHIMKLKAAGLYVSDDNLKRIKNMSANLSKLSGAINNEVEKLRGHTLADGKISLLDILQTDDPRYVSNESLRPALDLIDYEEYPQYESLIKLKLKKDIQQIDQENIRMSTNEGR